MPPLTAVRRKGNPLAAYVFFFSGYFPGGIGSQATLSLPLFSARPIALALSVSISMVLAAAGTFPKRPLPAGERFHQVPDLGHGHALDLLRGDGGVQRLNSGERPVFPAGEARFPGRLHLLLGEEVAVGVALALRTG